MEPVKVKLKRDTVGVSIIVERCIHIYSSVYFVTRSFLVSVSDYHGKYWADSK